MLSTFYTKYDSKIHILKFERSYFRTTLAQSILHNYVLVSCQSDVLVKNTNCFGDILTLKTNKIKRNYSNHHTLANVACGGLFTLLDSTIAATKVMCREQPEIPEIIEALTKLYSLSFFFHFSLQQFLPSRPTLFHFFFSA